MSKTVKKWLAWIKVRKSWAYIPEIEVLTHEIEVHETEKTFRLPKDFRLANDQAWEGLGYRTVLSKDDGILHDTEKDAVLALNDREYERLQKNTACLRRQENEYSSVANKLKEML